MKSQRRIKEKTINEFKNFNSNIKNKINPNSNIKAYWNFFPTPKNLIEKMLEEYKTKPLPKNILEPSAGKGDIIDYINKIQNKRKQQSNIYAFEFVEELRNIIKQKDNCQILGNDFLQYQNSKSKNKSKNINFDLILMNPPFDKGVNHVLHAWDLLSREGQVIALLNKHTYYNAYNSHRLKLKSIIDQFGEVEYLGDCFTSQEKVERTAQVGVVLLKIKKKADSKYQDIGINLSQYSINDIRNTKAKYVVRK